MQFTSMALLIYISLFCALAITIPTWRAVLTLFAGRRSNSFTPSGADISPLFERICRAHANCYENFPLIGGLLLLALATGRADITNGLALYFIGARLVQTLVHILSTAEIMVNIRFTMYYIQLVIAFIWIIQLAQGF